MSVFEDNFLWMLNNILLALIPVYAGFLFSRTKNTYGKILFGLIWLFFVPNTIYILTDLIHLPRQLSHVTTAEIPFLFLQYVVLEFVGIVCFILAVNPIERIAAVYLKKYHIKTIYFIFALNFLIAFGVTLGRFQRTNSWEVVTNLPRVMQDIVRTLTTPQMVLFIVIFGVTSNLIYFLFSKSIRNEVVVLLKRTGMV